MKTSALLAATSLLAFLPMGCVSGAGAATPERAALPDSVARDLAACNIVWESPARDSFDSMPLPGARGAGANVWVQDGAVWVYLAHNGAYDEEGRHVLYRDLYLQRVQVAPRGFLPENGGFANRTPV